MLKLVLGVLFALIAAPSLALDKEAEESLDVAASMLVYRDMCESPTWVTDRYHKHLREGIDQGSVSEDAALKYVIDRAALLSTSIEAQEKQDFFCAYVLDAFKELGASASETPSNSYSRDLLSKKGLLLLDGLILSAIGLVLALVVGLAVKLVSGRNLLKEPWWFVIWVAGLYLLGRVLARVI